MRSEVVILEKVCESRKKDEIRIVRVEKNIYIQERIEVEIKMSFTQNYIDTRPCDLNEVIWP